jgi:hypothetical protein
MVSVTATMDGASVEIVEIGVNGADVYVSYIESGSLYVKRKAFRNDSNQTYMTLALSATAA